MTFIESQKKLRQKRFETKYHFLCQCDACKDNYPTFSNLEKQLPDEAIDLVESNFAQIEKKLSDNEPLLAVKLCRELYKHLEPLPYLHAAKQRTRVLLGTCIRMAYCINTDIEICSKLLF